MSAVLKRAQEHFKARLTSADMQCIDVPEWDCRMYWRPTIKLIHKDRILKAFAEGGTRWMAVMLVQLAMDEDGRRLFKESDVPAILGEQGNSGVDDQVVARIVNAMQSVFRPEDYFGADPLGREVDEARENFNRTPSGSAATD